MKDAKILLGVTGGIAAYKIAHLVRSLRDEGAQVRVVMTDNAQRFVTQLTFETLSGNPVSTSMWDRRTESATEHIELARWADVFLVAPATANTIAKLALGLADDLLSTVALASTVPLVVAPAMNSTMWQHPAVQQNTATLAARGTRIAGPAAGDLACGETGPGRMLEPDELVVVLREVLAG